MKIKIDENLPKSLTHIIKEQGYDVESVFTQGLSGCDDEKIWNIIKEESRGTVHNL